MITTVIRGGLGNQLFRYAAGRSLALRHSAELQLETSFFERRKIRSFQLGKFQTQEAGVEPSRSVLGEYNPEQVFIGDGPGWSARFDDLPAHCLIDGYCQSERYFCEHSDVIRQELSPGEIELSPQGVELEERMLNCNSVAVHVRQGDYLQLPTHNICRASYYNNAIPMILQHVEDPHFFGFSDEPELAASEIGPWAEKFEWVRLGDHQDVDLMEFRLLSACRHQVLPNSTFSWWAAWLNANPDKVVVAPEAWTLLVDKNVSNIVPGEWLRAKL